MKPGRIVLAADSIAAGLLRIIGFSLNLKPRGLYRRAKQACHSKPNTLGPRRWTESGPLSYPRHATNPPIHDKERTGTQPRRVHRPGKPRDGFPEPAEDPFEVQKVLERLVEKGKLIVKKAYADWSRYPSYTAPFHEAAIELIEIPKRSQTGKNSADIRLVVDAMDLAWSKPHVDTFVIVSGDSDFSPLVSKLKENGKHVIGLGMKGSTSDLLRDNCDEFIYYEDLERQEQNEQQLATDLNSYLPPTFPSGSARSSACCSRPATPCGARTTRSSTPR